MLTLSQWNACDDSQPSTQRARKRPHLNGQETNGLKRRNTLFHNLAQHEHNGGWISYLIFENQVPFEIKQKQKQNKTETKHAIMQFVCSSKSWWLRSSSINYSTWYVIARHKTTKNLNKTRIIAPQNTNQSPNSSHQPKTKSHNNSNNIQRRFYISPLQWQTSFSK